MTDYDAIIIGAGHNGLICASYLAKAGKNVLVLDARNEPGGCASTREFAPGHHVSDCAQWLSQFDQSIVKDLDLKAAGLKLGKPKTTISLQSDGDHLVLDGDTISGAGVDSADQAAYRDFKKMVRSFAKLMTTLYRSRPAQAGGAELDRSPHPHEAGSGPETAGPRAPQGSDAHRDDQYLRRHE